MWESIKKDPLIKTIVVILIGVLAFGFAFNIMFGAGGSTMDDGSMMGSGYSLSNTLENIIELLIKLVIISVLIGVIVWIFRSMTTRTGSIQTDRLTWLKEDPIIKNTLIIVGAVIVLLFAFWLLKGNIATGSGDKMMTGGMAYSTAYLSFSLPSIFAFILKSVIFILLITLIYGIAMYLKENYFDSAITQEVHPSEVVTKDCPECNSKLKDNWKCCPYCGSDKAYVEAEHEET
ncbi:MAG: hypothetical protein K0R34_2926 [Herbinix sp.]|nr:hypothetical protein [Herbinix sp.]